MTSSPQAGLQEIRDKHYLSPEDFTKALHNDPNIFNEDERFYLEKLAQKEQQIIDEVQEWAGRWGQSPVNPENQQQITELLVEIIGPLTPQAKQEILGLIRQNLSEDWIQAFPITLRSEMLNTPAKGSDKGLKYLPWGLLSIGLTLLALSSYGASDILLPLGGISLLCGAVWLYLRS